MKKVKVMSKEIEGIQLRLTLTKMYRYDLPVYGIVAETDDDICFVPDIGTDPRRAEGLCERLFLHDVMPCTLADIIRDLGMVTSADSSFA